jgi:hypothetical protein
MPTKCAPGHSCGGGNVIPGSSTVPGTPGWQVVLAGGTVGIVTNDDGTESATYTVGDETVFATTLQPVNPVPPPDITAPPPPPVPPPVVVAQSATPSPPVVIAGSTAAGGDAATIGIPSQDPASVIQSPAVVSSIPIVSAATHTSAWVWLIIALVLAWLFFERGN